ncbi:MAG: hypothetical protein QXO71_09855 [Candidatus Jordarchaeaceae archaeon]
MDEKEINKIWAAYNKAAPHLSELLWLKNEINSLISNTKNLGTFIDAINQKIQEEKTISRKTDLKIFIFYLTKNSLTLKR